MTADADDRRTYAKDMDRKVRRLAAESSARAVVMQLNWIVVLMAGAAVPLSTALDWGDWVAPVLGFVVVVAAGIDRIFARTAPGAVAVDQLRRRLDREQRLWRARQLEYGDTDDPLGLYVLRSEEAIAEFDRAMIDYNRRLVQETDS